MVDVVVEAPTLVVEPAVMVVSGPGRVVDGSEVALVHEAKTNVAASKICPAVDLTLGLLPQVECRECFFLAIS